MYTRHYNHRTISPYNTKENPVVFLYLNILPALLIFICWHGTNEVTKPWHFLESTNREIQIKLWNINFTLHFTLNIFVGWRCLSKDDSSHISRKQNPRDASFYLYLLHVWLMPCHYKHCFLASKLSYGLNHPNNYAVAYNPNQMPSTILDFQWLALLSLLIFFSVQYWIMRHKLRH